MAKRSSLSDSLERRARRAIFWHSLLRWESAVVIALVLVIVAFSALLALTGNGPLWLWPLGPLVVLGVGVLVEVVLFVSSITDEKEHARVVAAMLQDQYKPRNLRTPKLKVQLNKALEYEALIASTVQRTQEGVLHDRLIRATKPVDDWIEAIYLLATRLDAYAQNRVIKRDLRSVPVALENFNKRLAEENDPTVQRTLRNTISDKERQWEHLSHLKNTMEKAEYQLESTLAALGTVYAQLQAIDVQGAEKGRTDRLREEIDEQVAQLQDLSEAMDEVYAAR
jgi:hypothetical protein